MPEEEEQAEYHRAPVVYAASELFYVVLFIIGIMLYFWYAITYNAWFDIGIVVVAMPFMAFGLVGMILNHLNREAREAHQKV